MTNLGDGAQPVSLQALQVEQFQVVHLGSAVWCVLSKPSEPSMTGLLVYSTLADQAIRGAHDDAIQEAGVCAGLGDAEYWCTVSGPGFVLRAVGSKGAPPRNRMLSRNSFIWERKEP